MGADDRADAREVFRARVLGVAAVQLVVLVVVQAGFSLVWPGQGPLQWVVFAAVFVLVWTVLSRPWLRVGEDSVVAGASLLRRERTAVGDVVLARPHHAGHDGRRGAARRGGDHREVRLHTGWGPAVLLERRDGSRVVVGVDDSRAALAALARAGASVSDRSGGAGPDA